MTGVASPCALCGSYRPKSGRRTSSRSAGRITSAKDAGKRLLAFRSGTSSKPKKNADSGTTPNRRKPITQKNERFYTMNNDNTYLTRLSNKTRCVIRKTPVPGEGLNRWLFPIAMCLIGDKVPEDQGVELLFQLAYEKGRDERTARKEAERLRRLWTGNGPVKSNRPPDPKVNLDSIRELVSVNHTRVADLVEQSPIKVDPSDSDAADNIVDLLFPDGDILCVARSIYYQVAYRHRNLDDPLGTVPFIVPNPMRAEGVYEKGVFSPKTNANVLYRRWLCVEWDIPLDRSIPSFWHPLVGGWADNGVTTKDAQTRLLTHLSTFEFRLAMVVDSGRKSLHSWFAVAHANEPQIEHFMRYAISIGADPAGRVPSQFFRMPHGTRDNGKRQPVLFIDPKVLTNNKRKK